MVLFYLSLVVVGAVADCQDDILLIPDQMYGDQRQAITRLADGQYGTYWEGDNYGGEYIYFYFTDEVQVKWIFIQRYQDFADYVDVWDGTTNFEKSYFGGSDEDYQSLTLRYNNVFTDMLRFYIYDASYYPRISRLEVYGCYNTSTPTMLPTTPWPTDVPTLLPTLSPTLPPVTTLPSKTPSYSPTTAPTVSPSTTNPSLYPSIAPSRSPTVPPSGRTVKPSQAPTYSPTTVLPTNHPSVAPSPSPTLEPSAKTVIPSQSPTTSPTTNLPTFKPSAAPSPSPTVEPTILASTLRPSISPSPSPTEPPTVVYADDGFQFTLGEIELFTATILCLCGVLIFLAIRYLRLKNMTEIMNSTEERMNKVYNADNIADGNERIELYDSRIQNDAISTAQRIESTEAESKKGVDILFALDKMTSNNSGSCTTPGNIEIGPQDSAV